MRFYRRKAPKYGTDESVNGGIGPELNHTTMPKRSSFPSPKHQYNAEALQYQQPHQQIPPKHQQQCQPQSQQWSSRQYELSSNKSLSLDFSVSRSPSPRKSSPVRKRLPEMLIEQQILAELEGIEPLQGIRFHAPQLTEYTTSASKKKIILGLVKEKFSRDELNVVDNGALYLAIAPTVNYMRVENPNIHPVTEAQLEELVPHGEIYPSVASLATKLSNVNISSTSITNITESTDIDNLFDTVRHQHHSNHKGQTETNQRPYYISSLSSLASDSREKAGLKLKKFSAKAKRFSAYADQKINQGSNRPRPQLVIYDFSSMKYKTNNRLLVSSFQNNHGRADLSSADSQNRGTFCENDGGSITSSRTSISTDTLETSGNVSSLLKLSRLDTQMMLQQQQNQFFVKYHIYSFHPTRMLLSTNPDRKHIYCRHAPGYSVDIQSPKLTPQSVQAIRENPGNKQSDLGFRLIIKERFTDSEEKGKEARPVLVVTKKSKMKGNGYMVWLLRHTVLDQYTQRFVSALNENQSAQEEQYWQAESLEVPFYNSYQNAELAQAVKKADSRHIMNRYEIKDLNDIPWLVGSIPKFKKSNMTRLKHYSKEILEGNFESGGAGAKITHKYDTFFFTPRDISNSMRVSSHEGSVSNGLGPSGPSNNKILALFRPHETKIKKKLIKDLKRFKNKSEGQSYLHNTANNSYGYNSMADDSTSDLYTLRTRTSMDTYSINAEGYDENIEEDEFLPGGGSKKEKFYQAGDGLLSKNPPDDSPNDNKLGWLTVYNEPYYLKVPGMFELVLGLTLAVGYERIINMQHDKSLVFGN